MITTKRIHLRNVTKSFGAIQAVRGVDIDIDPGQTVALLGPNGAGKSTTLDLILGPPEAWLVLAVWAAVLSRLAVGAFRRDTARA